MRRYAYLSGMSVDTSTACAASSMITVSKRTKILAGARGVVHDPRLTNTSDRAASYVSAPICRFRANESKET